MFHQSVSKYGLATHLALAAALPAALAQFVSTEWLSVSMLWVSFLAWIWLLFEPSVLSGETVSTARRRVLRGIARDPFAWFLAIAVVFALVRWLNSGVKMFYALEAGAWSVKMPSWSIFPASSGQAGLLPLAVAVAIFTTVVGIRHALGKSARIWFGVMFGAFSAVGALAALIYVGLEGKPFLDAAMADFGAPSFAGTMYAVVLPVSISCGIAAEARGITKARLLLALGVAGNFAGALVFLPGLLGFGYVSASVATAGISLLICKWDAGVAACARAASMLAFGVAIAVSVLLLPSYKDVVEKKTEGLDSKVAFTASLADRNEVLRKVSIAIWNDFQWGGAGVGAFRLHAPFHVNKDDWHVLPPRPTESGNGYLTILAERGIIGALFWVIGIGFLLYWWVSRLVGSVLWFREQDDSRIWFACIPSVVWVSLLTLAVCLIDTWFSSGMALTPLAVCSAAAMSLGAASFPRLKRKTVKEGQV